MVANIILFELFRVGNIFLTRECIGVDTKVAGLPRKKADIYNLTSAPTELYKSEENSKMASR